MWSLQGTEDLPQPLQTYFSHSSDVSFQQALSIYTLLVCKLSIKCLSIMCISSATVRTGNLFFLPKNETKIKILKKLHSASSPTFCTHSTHPKNHSIHTVLCTKYLLGTSIPVVHVETHLSSMLWTHLKYFLMGNKNIPHVFFLPFTDQIHS